MDGGWQLLPDSNLKTDSSKTPTHLLSADATRHAVCRLTFSDNQGEGRDAETCRRSFAKFVDYFAKKGRAGLVETKDGRRVYLVPPGTAVCARMSVDTEPRPCLLGLVDAQ